MRTVAGVRSVAPFNWTVAESVLFAGAPRSGCGRQPFADGRDGRAQAERVSARRCSTSRSGTPPSARRTVWRWRFSSQLASRSFSLRRCQSVRGEMGQGLALLAGQLLRLGVAGLGLQVQVAFVEPANAAAQRCPAIPCCAPAPGVRPARRSSRSSSHVRPTGRQGADEQAQKVPSRLGGRQMLGLAGAGRLESRQYPAVKTLPFADRLVLLPPRATGRAKTDLAARLPRSSG